MSVYKYNVLYKDLCMKIYANATEMCWKIIPRINGHWENGFLKSMFLNRLSKETYRAICYIRSLDR
jgi:hypothetical protein